MAFTPKIDEMTEAPDDRNGTLTCGVELEFLLPSIHCMAKDPDPNIKNKSLYRSTSCDLEDIKTEVREQLLKTLRQLHGIPFRDMDDDDFHPPHGNVVIYDSWRLGHDSSVIKQGAEGPYNWTNCELTSPVMDSHDYGTKMEDVCRVLKALRIHLNESTAVHVHVGRGDEPFSLLTVKKFVTLYWLAENAIFELHHPSRRDNGCCLPLTDYSVLAIKSQAAPDDAGRDLNDGGLMMEDYVTGAGLARLRHAQLRHIWDCGDIEEIAKLMCIAGDKATEPEYPYKRGSVGFQRFLPAGKTGGNIQTFEWRQMSGSIDANHINQWVKACIAFTDFCRLSDKATFRKLIGEIIEKGENYTGVELLEALDVDTCIFKDMREAWAQDPSFCDESQGEKLFVSK